MKQNFQPCWMYDGSGYYAVQAGVKRLPAGLYSVFETQKGYEFYNVEQFKDEIFDLPGLPNELISEQVSKFWANKDLYEKHKFVHKRGILLYGPPGNGKSAIVAKLVNEMIKEDGVIIAIGRFSIASNALVSLRKIEPQRKLMTLIEDMDTLLSGDYKQEEPHALSMLDGQTQVNSILHIATTNYPELLADRFIKRPGRFDFLVGMGMPAAETRCAYFQKLLGVDHPAIKFLTDKTDGLSLAYLKEIASTYLCLGVPVEESVARLKESYSVKIKVKKATAGFKVGYHEDSFQSDPPPEDTPSYGNKNRNPKPDRVDHAALPAARPWPTAPERSNCERDNR